ncbi:MAG: gamma-glutamyltransferase [Gammaproteobacteria bacterium]|nr:gamma-glutamyltransferase [Gammaproteobacteria bacterium]
MNLRIVTCWPPKLLLAASAGWAQDDGDLATAVTTHREMVVTANPLATAAGAHILKIGGTAVDAMVAVQTVLGLVEPQSTGIGGGAFIVYYDAKHQQTITLDAREKAPAAATEDRFVNAGGFTNAWQSGLSVGVPGVPRMMEHMHAKYGRLPWQRLFVPAKVMAQRGFALTERTSSQVAGLLAANPSCADGERLFFRDPVAFEYFVNTDDCTAKPAGTRMINKPYANTLKALARWGADAFYHGPIAEDIAAAVQGDLNIPGDMTTDDLANYQVVEREPVCMYYRGHRVCGMGPPSSGGLAVGQILGLMENRPDLMGSDPLDVDTVHLFTQAGRLAFADRNQYVGDSDFVSVPVAGMLDEGYLADRAALITETDMGPADPGIPPGVVGPSGPHNAAKLSGTSHVSIVDRYGNALSMTTTVESSFGNGVMVRGFLLNNELTDFSFAPTDNQGNPVANRVQPNKRPRSSMSPTLVFDADGKVELVTGSPGGSRIIGYTAQSIVNVIDFGLDPQEAINVPHYMNRNGRTDIEEPIPGITLEYDAQALADALEAKGHNVGIIAQTSGLSIIQVVESEYHKKGKKNGKGRKHHHHRLLIGGADKRRDGTVGGR